MFLQTNNSNKRRATTPLGVYLHVPFCSTSCDFCAFYQVQSDRNGILGYIDSVRREVELVDIGDRGIDTVFWGGGTPGLLPANDMEAVASALTARFGVPREEWTVEMAPSSVKKDKLKALKDVGVTRISMGIQSLSEASLEALGRQHARKQILKAYDLIREQDFKSVNLDLIFAIPGQSEAEWRQDIRETLALQPDHLSTYCLTFEEDTALFLKLQQGKVSIDPEREVAYYAATWEETAAAGFQQYEISNYAKPGHECIHNLNTWRMGEWIGIGPSAAEQYSGRRQANTPDLRAWMNELAEGKRGQADKVVLSNALLFEDSLIFGLRLNEGIDLAELQERYQVELSDEKRWVIDRLLAEGKVASKGERLMLTDTGRLLADAVGAELMD